jgi:hypothetical protein
LFSVQKTRSFNMIDSTKHSRLNETYIPYILESRYFTFDEIEIPTKFY